MRRAVVSIVGCSIVAFVLVPVLFVAFERLSDRFAKPEQTTSIE
jgi:hypothetical protein